MKASFILMSVIFFSLNSVADEGKINYTIISENSIPTIKYSLDVSLDKKISKQELENLAVKLKGDHEYDRVFIGYVINKKKVTNGYWATTHFNPDLEVKILGLSLDQEIELKKNDDGESREVISKWVDDRPYIGAKMTIYKEDNKFYLESIYPDKSSSKKEINLSKVKRGEKIETVEENGHGEYFVINTEGSLEFWSESGNYYTVPEHK